MSKTKITQITRYAYPHIGGIETVINQINESLSDEDFEKEVFCCSNTDKSSIEHGVKYYRCKYLFNFASNSISPHLFFKMMFLKTDIIHFHMPVIQNVIFWFVLYHLGFLKYKKMIVTYHSDIIGYDKFMKPLWGIYKYFLSKADKIHVLSPNIIESSKILSEYKTKCVVIPFGINVEEPSQFDSNIKNKEKYNNKKIIFSCGRLVKYKGFKYGIEAMKNVENAVYLIGGNGPLKDELEILIKQNNLQDKVFLLGKISDEELYECYRECDIYLFPSTMASEAFGIVQLEAMQYGKPVINTRLNTGVNYVSIDNETGLTVQVENAEALSTAINELLYNDELRLKYGKNARRRVEELFDIRIISKKYENLVKNND